MVYSSGAMAEFQDGSYAGFRSNSAQIMRSGSSIQLESGSKLAVASGAKVHLESGSSFYVAGPWHDKVSFWSTDTAGNIPNHGIIYMHSSCDNAYKIDAPTSGCILRLLVYGADSTNAILRFASSVAVFNKSSCHSVCCSSGVAKGRTKWCELIGVGSATWVMGDNGPYTSLTNVWTVSTASTTDI